MAIKTVQDQPLTIGSLQLNSRLIIGSGKYKNFQQTADCLASSGAEMITVAIRRVNIGQDSSENILDYIPKHVHILPNTAGCYTADDAVQTSLLARELLDDSNLIKLEVLNDPNTLFPQITETLKAAEILVKEGFEVYVYTSDDPVVAKTLEEIGVKAIMPLASLIGSGMGLLNPWNIQLILEQAKIPVIVDAGIGTASDATICMELGSAAVLTNTALAKAQDPILMSKAMKLAVESGRLAYLAGRMTKHPWGHASSPNAGKFFD